MQEFSPSVFVDSTEDGIRLVKEGEYAFLLESKMLEFITERSCDLTQVGGLLDTKGYGIGTPRGMPPPPASLFNCDQATGEAYRV